MSVDEPRTSPIAEWGEQTWTETGAGTVPAEATGAFPNEPPQNTGTPISTATAFLSIADTQQSVKEDYEAIAAAIQLSTYWLSTMTDARNPTSNNELRDAIDALITEADKVPWAAPPPAPDTNTAQPEATNAPPPKKQRTNAPPQGKQQPSGRSVPNRSASKKPILPYQRPAPVINLATKPKKSYASAAKAPPAASKARGTEALVSLAKALPNLPARQIIEIQKRTTGARDKRKRDTPSFTASGPTRKQLLLQFDVEDTPAPELNLDKLVKAAEFFIIAERMSIRVLSAAKAYGGYALATSTVPSRDEITLLSEGIRMKYFVETPALRERKFVLDLPQSWSYLKLIDVPYFQTPLCNIRMETDEIEEAMKASALANDFTLKSGVCIVRTSKASTNSTVYFEVWDSQ